MAFPPGPAEPDRTMPVFTNDKEPDIIFPFRRSELFSIEETLRSRCIETTHNRWNITTLPSIFLTISLFGACNPAPSPTAGYPKEIYAKQAKTEISNGPLVLDVRELSEYTESHIPGSRLIPLGELSTHLQELPHDRLIIVVCRFGARSAQGRDTLLAAGFPKVTSISSGMQTWIAAGYPVESGPPTNP